VSIHGDKRPERCRGRSPIDAVPAGPIQRTTVAVGGGDELYALRLAELQRGVAGKEGARLGIGGGRAGLGPGCPWPGLECTEPPAIRQGIPGQAKADAQGNGEHHDQVEDETQGSEISRRRGRHRERGNLRSGLSAL
jgi:hypothetical protein